MSPGADAARRDEMLVVITQTVVSGHHHLLAAYEGGDRRTQAQRDITSSCHHSGGPRYSVQVKGKDVLYDWYGVEGKVKIVELLKIAADHGTPAKVNRLRHHARAWIAAHQARERLVGPGGGTKALRESAEYRALDEAGQHAYVEMLRARERWWEIENATEETLWWAGLDALRFAVIPADVPAALAFYSVVVSDEHRALAQLRREEFRAAEEVAAA